MKFVRRQFLQLAAGSLTVGAARAQDKTQPQDKAYVMKITLPTSMTTLTNSPRIMPPRSSRLGRTH